MIFEKASVEAIIEFVFQIIFGGASIIIFCISTAKSKKYIEAPAIQNFRSAQNFNAASIVFFVLNCGNFIQAVGVALYSLVSSFGHQYLGSYHSVMGTDEILMYIETALSVVVCILGIIALVKYSKAQQLFKRLNPPAPTPYNNPYYNGGGYYNGYPNQNAPYGNNRYPQQPPYTQQPADPRQPFSDPGQNYQQPVSYNQKADSTVPFVCAAASSENDSMDKQPKDTADIGSQADNAENGRSSSAPEGISCEKRCPSCGVVNDGKNKFCTFCGKAL